MKHIDWSFLDTFNATAFQGWAAVWLWIGTGIVWGIAAIVAAFTGKALPVSWLATWLTGIAGLAGIGALQFKTMRDTDWKALEIKHGKDGAAPRPAAKEAIDD